MVSATLHLLALCRASNDDFIIVRFTDAHGLPSFGTHKCRSQIQVIWWYEHASDFESMLKDFSLFEGYLPLVAAIS